MNHYKAYSLEEAKRKLESYCAYQERCHKDVVEKLRGMKMIPEAIDQIATHLIQENYLNEERFARSFARGKFNIKKWGSIFHLECVVFIHKMCKYSMYCFLLNQGRYSHFINP